jgi:hypothetical protein
VRRTERNRLRRVADRQILTAAIEHSQKGFRKFRGRRPLFLMQTRLVAAEARTSAQYGLITLARNQ